MEGASEQGFGESEVNIMNNIINLVNNNNAAESEQYLTQLYVTHGEQYIDCLLGMLGKFVQGIWHGQHQPNHANALKVLLYLRMFMEGYKGRLGNYLRKLDWLCNLVKFDRTLRQISLKCYGCFLGKLTHMRYLKEYLESMAGNLIKQAQTGHLDTDFLLLAVEVLESLMENRMFHPPGIIGETERYLRMFLVSFVAQPPAALSYQDWVKAVVVIYSFTSTSAPFGFVSSCLRNQNNQVQPQILFKLFEMFKRHSDKAFNLEELYGVLRAQLRRAQNPALLESLWSSRGMEAIESLVQSIKICLKNSLAAMTPTQGSGQVHQELAEINTQMLISYYYSPQNWVCIIRTVVGVLEQYRDEQTEIAYLLMEIFEELCDFFKDGQEVGIVVALLKAQVKEQYMLCFLGGMSRKIMEEFHANQMIFSLFAQIRGFKDVRDLNYNMFYIELYLQFVMRFLKVHFYLGEEGVVPGIEKQVLAHIGSLHERPLYPGSKDYELVEILQYNVNVRKMKGYDIAIRCMLQKFNYQHNYDQIMSILNDTYGLLQLLSQHECNENAEILAVLNEGFTELQFIKKYKMILNECLLGYFAQLAAKTTPEFLSLLVHGQLFRILLESFDFETRVHAMPGELWNVLQVLMRSGNKSLADDACEFVLKILFYANTHMKEAQQLEQLLACVYEVGVYGYIEECFMKEDEDFLYCKILMETVIHPKGKVLVEQILSRVCARPGLPALEHNFDKLWEALVILYDVRNEYTQGRGINKKVDEILGGNIQGLLLGLSIDEKKEYSSLASRENRKIKWAWLPDVRKILEPGSYSGVLVEKKLNQI